MIRFDKNKRNNRKRINLLSIFIALVFHSEQFNCAIKKRDSEGTVGASGHLDQIQIFIAKY